MVLLRGNLTRALAVTVAQYGAQLLPRSSSSRATAQCLVTANIPLSSRWCFFPVPMPTAAPILCSLPPAPPAASSTPDVPTPRAPSHWSSVLRVLPSLNCSWSRSRGIGPKHVGAVGLADYVPAVIGVLAEDARRSPQERWLQPRSRAALPIVCLRTFRPPMEGIPSGKLAACQFQGYPVINQTQTLDSNGRVFEILLRKLGHKLHLHPHPHVLDSGQTLMHTKWCDPLKECSRLLHVVTHTR